MKWWPWSKKSGGAHSAWELLKLIYGSRETKSGRTVNAATALEVSTVFACCRVIGEGIAQVPLKLMQESADGKQRIPAKQHPLYRLLSSQPNPWQTSFEFRETIAWHVVLTGTAFVFKVIVAGRIRELIPLQPGLVRVLRSEDGTLTYKVKADNGNEQTFPESTIWRIPGPSWNGYLGLDCMLYAREAIGLSMSAEESGSSLLKNGIRNSGVYSVEGTLTQDQHKMLRDWIESNNAGVENAGRTMLLDRAAKFTPTSMSGVDAQLLESRRFQIEEICRFFRVMPIMVGYSDKAATYASAEQMFLAHVVHTLAPWYQRLEQSIDANLLTEKERESGLYACFVEEGLLRGSLKDTKDYLLGLVNGGLMTPNEGRSKLDLNPDTDPASDLLRVPANIVGEPADKPITELEPTP